MYKIVAHQSWAYLFDRSKQRWLCVEGHFKTVHYDMPRLTWMFLAGVPAREGTHNKRSITFTEVCNHHLSQLRHPGNFFNKSKHISSNLGLCSEALSLYTRSRKTRVWSTGATPLLWVMRQTLCIQCMQRAIQKTSYFANLLQQWVTFCTWFSLSFQEALGWIAFPKNKHLPSVRTTVSLQSFVYGLPPFTRCCAFGSSITNQCPFKISRQNMSFISMLQLLKLVCQIIEWGIAQTLYFTGLTYRVGVDYRRKKRDVLTI